MTKAKRMSIDDLTDDQVLALARWIRAHTERTWRSQLLVAWERAGAGVAHYSPQLQILRNSVGPSRIQRLKPHDVLREGAAVAAAYGETL